MAWFEKILRRTRIWTNKSLKWGVYNNEEYESNFRTHEFRSLNVHTVMHEEAHIGTLNHLLTQRNMYASLRRESDTLTHKRSAQTRYLCICTRCFKHFYSTWNFPRLISFHSFHMANQCVEQRDKTQHHSIVSRWHPLRVYVRLSISMYAVFYCKNSWELLWKSWRDWTNVRWWWWRRRSKKHTIV